MNVEVYTKAGCRLCDEALEALRVAGICFIERDIGEQSDWFSRFRHAVPVVHVDGVERLRLRWTSQEFDRVFRCERSLPVGIGDPVRE